MEHDRLKEKISDLYDGELSGEARREAEAHLASCAECRAFHANLGALSAGLSARLASGTDEAFTRAVMARVRAEKTSSGPRLVPVQWFAPLVGVAAMALLALLPAPHVSAGDLLTGGQEWSEFAAEEA